MLDSFVDLLASYATSAFMLSYIYPIFCLAFVVTVPFIIRSFLRR